MEEVCDKLRKHLDEGGECRQQRSQMPTTEVSNAVSKGLKCTFVSMQWNSLGCCGAAGVGHSMSSVKSAQVVVVNMLTIAARYIHSNNEYSNFF